MPSVKYKPIHNPGMLERVINVLGFMSFRDRELERRFLSKQHKEHLGFNRNVSILGFVAVSGFYLMNYLLLNPVDIRLYILPYYIAAVALGVFILMTLIDMPHYVFNTLAMLAVLIISIAPLVSLLAFRYPKPSSIRVAWYWFLYPSYS